MVDDEQNVTEFTPAQQVFLEAAKSNTGKPTITNLCNKAGIKRPTFYRWLANDPEFAKAWEALWTYSIDGAMPAIVEAQIAKATGPKRDTQAAAFLTNLRGKMVRRVDITSGGEKIGIEYIGDWRSNSPQEED